MEFGELPNMAEILLQDSARRLFLATQPSQDLHGARALCVGVVLVLCWVCVRRSVARSCTVGALLG